MDVLNEKHLILFLIICINVTALFNMQPWNNWLSSKLNANSQFVSQENLSHICCIMPVTYLLVYFLEDPNMAYNSPHKCNMQLKNNHFQNIMLKAKNSIIIYSTDAWSTWTILNAKYVWLVYWQYTSWIFCSSQRKEELRFFEGEVNIPYISFGCN